MKIKLYVDWSAGEVLTEAELDAKIESEATKNVADDDEFAEWLRDEYTAIDVFNFTEDDRVRVLDEWTACCRERACVDLMEYYELIEKEI